MLPITSVYGVTILTTMSAKFSIGAESKILIFLIRKTYFSETDILGVTQFATEGTSNRRKLLAN